MHSPKNALKIRICNIFKGYTPKIRGAVALRYFLWKKGKRLIEEFIFKEFLTKMKSSNGIPAGIIHVYSEKLKSLNIVKIPK